jgi:tetratricopeptide (TPR) repeat protein
MNDRSKIIIVLILLAGYVFPARNLDSLKSVLTKTISDKDRVKTYIRLIMRCDNFDSVTYFANQGVRFCEEKNDLYGQALILTYISDVCSEHSEFEEGIKWCNRALAACKKANNDTLITRLYLYKGFAYQAMGDYLNATDEFLNCLRYAEKTGNKKTMASANNLLGLTFATKKPADNKKALEYYAIAEKIDREVHNMTDLGFALLRQGEVHINMKDYDKAERCLSEALRVGDSLNIVEVQKWTIETFAVLYRKKEDNDKALQMFFRSIRISVDNMDWPGLVNSAGFIAEIYSKKGDLKKAVLYSDSAILLSEKHKIYSALHHLYKGRSAICEALHDDKSALKYYKRSVELRDSLFEKENSNNLNELEKKYQTQKKEKELTEKKGELLVQKADNEKQQAQRNFFIAGTVLFLGFSIFIFRGYRQKQKANKIIAMQKKEVEAQKEVIEEKQKEVLDSIHYAKRIQQSLLPTEKYIHKSLDRTGK